MKTKDEKRIERDLKKQEQRATEATDVFVIDRDGDAKPAPVGPSIFDV